MKLDAMKICQSRRTFLRSALAVGAGAAVAGSITSPLRAADLTTANASAKPAGHCLKKAVKLDMVAIEGSIADKFALLKELGFEGCEINSPADIDKEAARKASDETGVKIH